MRTIVLASSILASRGCSRPALQSLHVFQSAGMNLFGIRMDHDGIVTLSYYLVGRPAFLFESIACHYYRLCLRYGFNCFGCFWCFCCCIGICLAKSSIYVRGDLLSSLYGHCDMEEQTGSSKWRRLIQCEKTNPFCRIGFLIESSCDIGYHRGNWNKFFKLCRGGKSGFLHCLYACFVDLVHRIGDCGKRDWEIRPVREIFTLHKQSFCSHHVGDGGLYCSIIGLWRRCCKTAWFFPSPGVAFTIARFDLTTFKIISRLIKRTEPCYKCKRG